MARRRGALETVLRAPVFLYRWHLGWLLGHRFLLLTHTGRRTGATHHTVLEVMRFDKARRAAVVMSGFGPGSDWMRNLEAGSPADLHIGRSRFRARVRHLPQEEAVAVLAGYERRNRFMAPVVRAVLSRLLGWTYCGTDAERRLVVTQLPLVGFAPDPSRVERGAWPAGVEPVHRGSCPARRGHSRPRQSSFGRDAGWSCSARELMQHLSPLHIGPSSHAWSR